MKKIIGICGIIAIVVSGCNSAKINQPAALLTATAWELSSINGKTLNAADYPNGLPTATFNAEHKVSGSGGCNQYSGSYNLNDEGGMNISGVISTKMFCEGSIENEYFAMLQKINMSKIDNDKLTLMEGVDERLVFVPKK